MEKVLTESNQFAPVHMRFLNCERPSPDPGVMPVRDPQWSFEHDATRGGYQLAYDDDGACFRAKSQELRGDQVLVVRMG